MPSAVSSVHELKLLQKTHPDLVLLDVRLSADHEAAHLPAAHSNCVFEVSFIGRVPDLVSGLDTPVCVYGWDAKSHEAAMAADKLERAGYTAVHVFRPGLDRWRQDDEQLETGEPPSTPATWPVGYRELNLEECRVEWLGRNLLNQHGGRVPLKAGHVVASSTGLDGGEFVLDMTGLTCDDLAGDDLAGTDLAQALIDHLSNDDFFDVARYPEARFQIREGRFAPDATPGATLLTVHGELTLKDVTAPLSFAAAAGVAPDGTVGAQATVVLDRTRWNVPYGSGRLFRRLGGHLVNDEIELRLRLVLA